jgi:hypothetical protein
MKIIEYIEKPYFMHNNEVFHDEVMHIHYDTGAGELIYKVGVKYKHGDDICTEMVEKEAKYFFETKEDLLKSL